MMKIAIKREQKQTHLSLPGVSNLRGAGAKAKDITRRLLLLPALVGFILASCVNDREYDTFSPEKGGDATVTFALNVPGNSAPATRGLSGNDETNIETIDVLLFRKDGSNNRLYWDKLPGVSLDNTAGSTKGFKVVIPVKDYSNYDITVVANARAIIQGAGLTRGESKAVALNKLVLDISGNSDRKWGSNKIPMWGEALNVDVDENTNLSGDNAVKMTRMISRIDVNLSKKAATGSDDPSGTGNANFELKSVRLYNYSTKGTVVPDFDNSLSWDAASDKAITPHQPAGGYGKAQYPAEDPLIYTISDQHSGDSFMPNSLIRAIYTLEALKGSNASLSTNTCLVIGGKYQGGEKETYYRIDFAVKNDETQQYDYLHLLRNHNYIVNITKITGAGFEKPEEAFSSRPVNIEADIVEWDEGGMGHIAFDGQNYLSVSQDEFSFSCEAITAKEKDNVLYVKTDVTGGWKIEKIEYANAEQTGWITLTPDRGVAGYKTEVVLSVAKNESEGIRSAVIWIAAGRLRYPVTVTQTLASALGIQLTDGQGNPVTELVFTNKAPIYPQILNVNWQPKDADLTVVKAAIGSLAQPSGTGIPNADITGGTGFQKYTITPSAFGADEIASNPFLEKVSRLHFTTTDGTSNASASVYLRQVNYAVVPVGFPDYPLDGKQHSFGIRCNTAWKIASITQKLNDETTTTAFLPGTPTPGDNLKKGQTGGYNVSTNGDMITFTVVDDPTLSGTIEVVFTSPDELFAPFTVTIIVNNFWARSNIVWDNDAQKLTFAVTRTDNAKIPANSQGVFFKWGSLVAISPAALEGTTATYTPGKYPNGHILYSPSGTYDYAYTGGLVGIPYAVESGKQGTHGAAEDDFAGYGGSTWTGPGYDASADRGDICRYISDQPGWVDGSWRLPTGKEIADLSLQGRNAYGWANTTVAPANPTSNGYGFYAPAQGGYWLGENAALSASKVNPEYGIFVPASGNRYFASGAADGAGFYGYVWSGSSDSNTHGCYQSVNPSGIYQYGGSRESGIPVRCVRDTGK